MRCLAVLATLAGACACPFHPPAQAPPARAVPPSPPAAPASSDRVLAVTIDDVPFVGGVGPGDDLDRATGRILAALHGVPATAFVACGRVPGRLGIVRRWRDAGVEIGNHTTSHHALDDEPLDTWLADARACASAVATETGTAPTRFRYPFLRTGPTPERRDEAARRIAALGWTTAPVTIDTSDWLLAQAYAPALQRGDGAGAAALRDALVAHVVEAARHYDQVARVRAGHAVPQVLLLHANALEADALPAVLHALAADGWTFAPLADVLSDPIYARDDDYAGPVGMSWLYRVAPADEAAWAWDIGRTRAMADRFGVADEGLPDDRAVRIDRDLRARRLSPRAIVVTHERPASANSLVVELDDRTLLLCSSPMTEAATERLLDWLDARFGRRRIVAVETHFHWDGAAGSGALRRRGAELWASDTTARLSRERGEDMRAALLEQSADDPALTAEIRGTHLAEPTSTFGTQQTLRFGADEVELFFPGPAHSPDNVVVWVARDRILFGGCFIRGGDSLGYLGDADVAAWSAALDRLNRYDPLTVVPGHGDRFDPDRIAATRALVRQALAR